MQRIKRRIKLALGIGLAAAMLAAAAQNQAAADTAAPTEDLKAAFVRGGELWMKQGGEERKLSEGEYVRNPKWSFDGRWIAYTRGETERELWLEEISTGKRVLVTPEAENNFQWSPSRTSLAYQIRSGLYLIDLHHSERQLDVADDIGNFSWMPDGSGFIVSSEARLLPSGAWTPIALSKVPLAAIADPGLVKRLIVLPGKLEGMDVVGTSTFKWSADGRRIAFLATPTASLSADGNTLCLLTADGTDFKTLDVMARNESWFQWSGQGETLAYIAGAGREATVNKKLTAFDVPVSRKTVLTPAGYADRGFAWNGAAHIAAVRAREAPWSADPAKSELTYLVNVSLEDGRQQIISPHGSGDARAESNPAALPGGRLSWVSSDRQAADVVVGDAGGRHAAVWIAGIDQAPDYYGQRNWDAVLRYYLAGPPLYKDPGDK